MLFVFSSLITIGSLKLSFVNEINVKSSWQQMTSTAIIKVAKRILIKNSLGELKKLQDYIKVGDPVTIQLGYDGKLQTEFIGYVSKSPRPSIPVEISCEDEMWKLKRKIINRQIFTNVKLKDIIESILPEYESDILNTEVKEDYSTINEQSGTAYAALKKVEDTFELKSFFRLVPTATGVKQVLVIGKPYSSEDLVASKPIKYPLRVFTKSDSLQYKFKDEEPVQIKGVCKVDDGKDLTSNYPKSDAFEGSVISRNFSNVNQEQLDKLVYDHWLSRNVDRFEGTVTGFAIPYARHGMVANAVDEFYEPMDSFNFIDTVELTADVNGGVQRICTLGYVANVETKQATR